MIINKLLLLPVWGRAAILLFPFMVVFWRIFRRVILWIMSGIPFLMGKIFRYTYLLFEIPIAALHKEFGSGFHEIDNGLSQMGERLDKLIDQWYTKLHFPKEYQLGKNLLVYGICILFVAIPSFMETDNGILRMGEKAYRNSEIFLLNLMEKHGWYNPGVIEVSVADIQQQVGDEAGQSAFGTIFVVSGVSSSLLVRDIPSMENCVVLERLGNGDKVLWTGEIQFSEAEDNHVEPWVKIITENGAEGWSRLFYLHPEEYVGVEFYVGECK